MAFIVKSSTQGTHGTAIPDQKEVEVQCVSSTESVTSGSVLSVQIQWMVQLPNSVYEVSIQCTPFNFGNHIGIQRGKGQWRDSVKPAFVQCISSV